VTDARFERDAHQASRCVAKKDTGYKYTYPLCYFHAELAAWFFGNLSVFRYVVRWGVSVHAHDDDCGCVVRKCNTRQNQGEFCTPRTPVGRFGKGRLASRGVQYAGVCTTSYGTPNSSAKCNAQPHNQLAHRGLHTVGAKLFESREIQAFAPVRSKSPRNLVITPVWSSRSA
jgi:hypothetical protein